MLRMKGIHFVITLSLSKFGSFGTIDSLILCRLDYKYYIILLLFLF